MAVGRQEGNAEGVTEQGRLAGTVQERGLRRTQASTGARGLAGPWLGGKDSELQLQRGPHGHGNGHVLPHPHSFGRAAAP